MSNRETCEQIGRANYDRAQLRLNSCQSKAADGFVCLDPPDYCVKCYSCEMPVCDKHRVEMDGKPWCLDCARADMDLDERAEALLREEVA